MIEVVPGPPAVHFISPSCSFPCFLIYNSKKYSGARMPVPLLSGQESLAASANKNIFLVASSLFLLLTFHFKHCDIFYPFLNQIITELWLRVMFFTLQCVKC